MQQQTEVRNAVSARTGPVRVETLQVPTIRAELFCFTLFISLVFAERYVMTFLEGRLVILRGACASGYCNASVGVAAHKEILVATAMGWVFLILGSLLSLTSARYWTRDKLVFNSTYAKRILLLAQCVVRLILYGLGYEPVFGVSVLVILWLIQVNCGTDRYAKLEAKPGKRGKLIAVGTHVVFMDEQGDYLVSSTAIDGHELPPLDALCKAQEMAVPGSRVSGTERVPPLLVFFSRIDGEDYVVGHGALVKFTRKGSVRYYILTAEHVSGNATRVASSKNVSLNVSWPLAPAVKGSGLRLFEGDDVYNSRDDYHLVEVNPEYASQFGVPFLNLAVPRMTTQIRLYAFDGSNWNTSAGGVMWSKKHGATHTASTEVGFSGTPILIACGNTYEVVGVHIGAVQYATNPINRFAPVGLFVAGSTKVRPLEYNSIFDNVRFVEPDNQEDWAADGNTYMQGLDGEEFSIEDNRVKARRRKESSDSDEPYLSDMRNRERTKSEAHLKVPGQGKTLASGKSQEDSGSDLTSATQKKLEADQTPTAPTASGKQIQKKVEISSTGTTKPKATAKTPATKLNGGQTTPSASGKVSAKMKNQSGTNTETPGMLVLSQKDLEILVKEMCCACIKQQTLNSVKEESKPAEGSEMDLKSETGSISAVQEQRTEKSGKRKSRRSRKSTKTPASSSSPPK